MSTYAEAEARAKAILANHPRWSEARVAEALISELSEVALLDLGRDHVKVLVFGVHRAKAREIEERATLRAEAERRRDEARGGRRHEPWVYNMQGRRAAVECGCEVCISALDEWRRAEDTAAAERSRDLNAVLDTALRGLSDRIRLEVTEDLLGSDFALGDGRRVTWRAATAEDHSQRIDLLRNNAVANVETAARHEAAIRMLSEAGVCTLGDLS